MSLVELFTIYDSEYAGLKCLFKGNRKLYDKRIKNLPKNDPEYFKEYLEWEKGQIEWEIEEGKWMNEDPEWRKECEKRHNM